MHVLCIARHGSRRFPSRSLRSRVEGRCCWSCRRRTYVEPPTTLLFGHVVAVRAKKHSPNLPESGRKAAGRDDLPLRWHTHTHVALSTTPENVGQNAGAKAARGASACDNRSIPQDKYRGRRHEYAHSCEPTCINIMYLSSPHSGASVGLLA